MLSSASCCFETNDANRSGSLRGFVKYRYTIWSIVSISLDPHWPEIPSEYKPNRGAADTDLPATTFRRSDGVKSLMPICITIVDAYAALNSSLLSYTDWPP